MTRIGNVDQVLLLLREQLQRAGKGGRAATRVSRGERAAPRPLDRVKALAALGELSEEDVRRAVVRGILTEEFGEGVGNDAALQRIVDDVARMIAEAPGGPELMARAVAQLKENGV